MAKEAEKAEKTALSGIKSRLNPINTGASSY